MRIEILDKIMREENKNCKMLVGYTGGLKLPIRDAG